MKSTRELELAPRQARSQGWGCDGCVSTPRHAKMVCRVEYRYLIISTRAGWHMINFKIHALECTRTRNFYVKKIQKFSGEGARPPRPIPQREGDTRGASNSLAPALRYLNVTDRRTDKQTDDLR